MANTMPGSLSRAASTATEPEPAPTSQTTQPASMASCARAMARTSACVIRPLLGRLWAKTSSGLPKRRRRPGDGGDLGLGDEGGLGPALGEDVGGVAEAAKAAGGRLQVRPAGLAREDEDVERCEFHVLNVAQFALRDALVGGAEVLADVGA